MFEKGREKEREREWRGVLMLVQGEVSLVCVPLLKLCADAHFELEEYPQVSIFLFLF